MISCSLANSSRIQKASTTSGLRSSFKHMTNLETSLTAMVFLLWLGISRDLRPSLTTNKIKTSILSMTGSSNYRLTRLKTLRRLLRWKSWLSQGNAVAVSTVRAHSECSRQPIIRRKSLKTSESIFLVWPEVLVLARTDLAWLSEARVRQAINTLIRWRCLTAPTAKTLTSTSSGDSNRINNINPVDQLCITLELLSRRTARGGNWAVIKLFIIRGLNRKIILETMASLLGQLVLVGERGLLTDIQGLLWGITVV